MLQLENLGTRNYYYRTEANNHQTSGCKEDPHLAAQLQMIYGLKR
jgi:hypothetical protein